MEQSSPHSSSDSNHTHDSNPHSLPSSRQTTELLSSKIKSIILIHSKENDQNPQRAVKYYSKASRKHYVKGGKRSTQTQKQFLKILKPQGKLSGLQYESDFVRNFQNVLLFSQFKNLPSLSSFSLSLSNFQKSHTNSFETLWKTLPHLKNLTTFEFILQLFPIQNPKVLTKLFKSTKKLNSLISLSFTFFYCTRLNPFHLKILSNHLKRFSQLQALKLAFENSLVLNGQKVFHDLVSVFPSLSSLSKLEISFDGLRELPSSDILELFMSLQHLKTLSDLTLNFKSCEISNRSDFEGSLSKILAYLALPSLHKLRLHFFNNLDDECLRTLSQVVKNLASLQTISLNLSNSQGYTDEGLTNFGLVLCCLTSLSSLTLHLPLSLNSTLGMVASILGPLCNLVKLKLQLTERISADCKNEIKTLFRNIRLMKSIKFLDIMIPHEQTMTDDDLEGLSESLTEQVAIINLSLDFGFSGDITNKGIESLSCAIKKVENLSGLALKFGYSDNLNEDSLCLLAEALSNRPSLNSIKLTFIQCSGIKGFGTLFEMFQGMKDTSDVLLNIPASKISGPEADYLKERKIFSNAWVL